MEINSEEIDAIKNHISQQQSIVKKLSDKVNQIMQSKQNSSDKQASPTETSRANDLKSGYRRADLLKVQIEDIRNELSKTNEGKVTELENRSKFLAQKINEKEKEISGLKKINHKQEQTLAALQQTPDLAKQRIEQLKQEIKSNKEKGRSLATKNKAQEGILKRQHEKCRDYEEKIRKINAQIKRAKGSRGQPATSVTEQDIEILKTKIDEMEAKKTYHEGQLKNRAGDLKGMEKQFAETEKRMKQTLAEKEKELRLNIMRVKELRNLARIIPGRKRPQFSGNGQQSSRNPPLPPMLPKAEKGFKHSLDSHSSNSSVKEEYSQEFDTHSDSESENQFPNYENDDPSMQMGKDNSREIFSKPKFSFR